MVRFLARAPLVLYFVSACDASTALPPPEGATTTTTATTPPGTSMPTAPAPAVQSAYLSVATERDVAVPVVAWDPAVVAAIEMLAEETGSRAAVLARADGVVIDRAGGGGPFAVASLSKALIALTVARLVDEGVVRFDERIADTIPSWRGDRGEVTIRHLLSHTSGLGSSLQRLGPPGGPGAYNLRAYDVVADIVQRRTGRPFVDVVNDKLVHPAGGTGVRWRVLEGSELGFDAGGGAEAHVADLVAVGRVIVGGGFVGDKEVIRARTLDELWRAHGEISRGFGAGLWLQYPRDNAIRFDIVEGRGGTGHMLSIVPDAGAVFVRIGNGQNETGVPERFHTLLRRLRDDGVPVQPVDVIAK